MSKTLAKKGLALLQSAVSGKRKRNKPQSGKRKRNKQYDEDDMAAEEPTESQLLRKMPSTKFREASAALTEARLAESYKQDLYEQNVKMLSGSRHGTTTQIVKKVAQYHLKIREEKIKEVEEKNWSLFAEEDAAAAAKKAKKKSRYA